MAFGPTSLLAPARATPGPLPERPEDTSDEEGRLVVRGVDEPPGGDGCDERPARPTLVREGNGRRGDGWLGSARGRTRRRVRGTVGWRTGDKQRRDDDDGDGTNRSKARDDRRRHKEGKQDDRAAAATEEGIRKDAAGHPREHTTAAGNRATRAPLSPSDRCRVFGEVRWSPTVDEQIQRVTEEPNEADRPDAAVCDDAAEIRQRRRRRPGSVSAAATHRPEDDHSDARDAREDRKDSRPSELFGDDGAGALPDGEADRPARGERRYGRPLPRRIERTPDDVDACVPDDDVGGDTAEDA